MTQTRPRPRALAVLGSLVVTVPVLVGVPTAQAAVVDITIDGTRTFQTMAALGADINPRSWDGGNLVPALDLLIDEGGLQTFRVGMDMMAWESVNDDDDPSTFNWDYYDPIYSGKVPYDTDLVSSSFADTWAVIDHLHERGVPDSRIILSFMGPGPDWMGGSALDPGMEDELVESVLSAAWWGWSHGHTFGLLSPDNEMDISFNEGVSMDADRYADVLDRLAGRMSELGMDGVQLLGPETCCDVSYAEPMKDHPRLMDRLAAFDFHNYEGDDNGAAAAVAGTGKDFWVSEYGDVDHTFAYLDQGAAGLLMWEAYDSVYNHAVLNGLGTAPGNDSLGYGITPLLAYDEDTRTYTPREELYHFGQLMRWVPVGAQRIGAESTQADVRVAAFRDPVTQRVTVVGQNTSESSQTLSLTLHGLPVPASLDYVRTNATSRMAPGPDVVVDDGVASVVVPSDTTFTLTGVPEVPTTPDPTAPTPSPTVTATPAAPQSPAGGQTPTTAPATAPSYPAVATALRRALRRATVTGRLAVGRTVRVRHLPAEVRPGVAVTYRFRWYAGSRAVRRATGASLVLTDATRDTVVSVTVRATHAGVSATRTIRVGRVGRVGKVGSGRDAPTARASSAPTG